MEEIKKVLLLVLGCAVQVGLGCGGGGVSALSHPVCGFVSIKLPLSEGGVKLPSAQHDISLGP